MAENIEKTVSCLKGIIDKNGPSYLGEDPYNVYKELIEQTADRKTAAALLHFLANGLLEDVGRGDAEQLSGIIRRKCSFNKQMSDLIATIMISLYSGENQNEWKKNDRAGLEQFLGEEFRCIWKGFSIWDAGNVTLDCHYEAEIILMPTAEIAKDEELLRQLKKNPFMTKEAIHNLFAERLRECLDYEFDYYCKCDDYYPPVVEDYGPNLEYNLTKWGEENGFKFVSFEGDGDDDGYEPKFRNNWY